MRNLLIVLILAFMACVPPNKDKVTKIDLDYKNPSIQKLYDFQDHRQVDSLLKYMAYNDDTYQYLCARAFAAIVDDKTKEPLSKLALDANKKVAEAAIYALSQFKSEDVVPLLQKAYDPYDTTLIRGTVNAAVLEAIGKCGTDNDLKNITSISNFTKYDTVLIQGQLASIYRFGLQNIYSKSGSELMAAALKNTIYSAKMKFWAAAYFNRKKEGDAAMHWPLKDYLQVYDALDNQGKISFIRGVGKTGTKEAFKFIKRTFENEKNASFKVSAIRTFKYFDYNQVQVMAWTAVDDVDSHVANTAVDFFVQNGVANEAHLYWKKAKQANIGKQISLKLYHAALKHMPYGFTKSINAMVWELKKLYRLNDKDPITQSSILLNLSEMPWQYDNISKMGQASTQPIVKTGAITALGNIIKRPDYNAYFNVSATAVKRNISHKFYEAIQFGDVGMISEAATVLADSSFHFVEVADSVDVLEKVLKSLSLPREIEGYNALVDAINTLTGEARYKREKPAFNHPIKWNLLSNIGSDSRARIHTSKGIIEIKFFTAEAPGTVANFINLVNAGFYKNKTFHRVIPNFVAQGGCPRGDGYGALDYSIRSEFGEPYYDKPGLLGMASAGLDTEGTQWFITHCRLPHLDGRYTVFAEVTEGMDVVQKLEIGDRIDKIDLLKI